LILAHTRFKSKNIPLAQGAISSLMQVRAVRRHLALEARDQQVG
jgi:hypothetical protein